MAQRLARLGIELTGLLLDGVEGGDPLQRLAGDLALPVFLKLEELAPGVGHAARFRDALGDQGLVARVVVADEGAAPVAEEVPGVLAGAAVGKVVDHRPHRIVGADAVGPQVGPMGLAGPGVEHRHRRLVGVQHREGEEFFLQGVDQRLQPNAHLADPLGQRGLGNGEARPAEDAFLAIERQMILILGHQHLSQQPGGGNALVNHVGGHRGLDQGFAILADPLAADVALDAEGAGGVVELLGDVLADAFHLAATGAGGGLRLMADLGARELGR